MHKDAAFLEHILDAIIAIDKFTFGFDLERFKNDDLVHSAVIRQFEIIGEASMNLSDKAQESIEVPWRDIVDMRNKLIHEYFGIDLNIVWRAITEDLQPLKKAILSWKETQ